MTPALTLDPDAARVIGVIRAAGRPRWETLSPEEARIAYSANRAVLQPDPPPVAEVRDLAAPGPAGRVPLRLYRPADAPSPAPAVMFFHGGGWVLGDLDSHDGVCRALAIAAGAVVIAVDYRLAPEHKFPAAIQDAAASVAWAAREAASLGIDPARMALVGDSAGGNLAAVIALMARDGALPVRPVVQGLIYPATDLVMNHASYARPLSDVPLTPTTMRWFGDLYCPRPADRLDWRASPLRATTLTGAAPAFVVTVGHDPLRDEGIDYARRLEREGVRVTHVDIADQIHGFLTMGRFMRVAGDTIAMLGTALRREFAPAFG